MWFLSSFFAIAQGRQRLVLAEIGWWRIAVAVVLFGAALLAHRWAFGVSPVAGLLVWLHPRWLPILGGRRLIRSLFLARAVSST